MTLVSGSINAYTFLQTFASLSAYFWKYFLSWLPCQCAHLSPNPLPQGLFVLWLSCCTSGSSGLPGGGSNSNESARNARDLDSIPGLERSPEPTPVFLPGGFHGQRSLAGYSPWGRKESDTTERLILLLLQGCLRNLSSSKTACYSPGNLTHAYTMTPFLLTKKVFYNSH